MSPRYEIPVTVSSAVCHELRTRLGIVSPPHSRGSKVKEGRNGCESTKTAGISGWAEARIRRQLLPARNSRFGLITGDSGGLKVADVSCGRLEVFQYPQVVFVCVEVCAQDLPLVRTEVKASLETFYREIPYSLRVSS